jgi:hypothetical protein
MRSDRRSLSFEDTKRAAAVATHGPDRTTPPWQRADLGRILRRVDLEPVA